MFLKVGRAVAPWQVFVCCAVITVLTIYLLPGSRGVYWARAEFVLVPPNSANFGNGLRAESGDAVMFAAAIEREFNGQAIAARPASTDATLYGLGVREGISVSLPNAGGQWQSSFSRASLVVQAVSSSEEQTRSELTQTLNRLTDLVRERQVAAGVDDHEMVRTSIAPTHPAVVYVGGSRKREIVAELLVGLGLSAALAAAWSNRRHDHVTAAAARRAMV